MKSKKISIIGAGGHARAVIGLLMENKIPVDGFYDEKIYENEEILGITGFHITNLPNTSKLILAIGNNNDRAALFSKFSERIYRPTIIHKSAYVHESVTIKNSSLIFPGAVINTSSYIGDNNIINTKCIIEHEAIINNHSHIAIGSIICGRVEIGDNCFIGAGAIIKDNIKVCNNVIVGAGAVVIKNIDEPGIYVGIPAKKIK